MAASATPNLGAPRPRLATGERAALLALAFLVLATAAWWALALWPAPDEPPAWLARARWVCFNAAPSGLPSASGWLVLIGEPLGLGVALWAAFGSSVRGGLRTLARSRGGRVLTCACAAHFALGAVAAGARIATLAGSDETQLAAVDAAWDAAAFPRLERTAPPLGLVDQRGARIELAQLRGRPALVTFAFAHCETVCPALVSQALAVQRAARAAGDGAHVPNVAIVTLDPWRDTPSRLPALAESWRLGDDAFVLSGAPDAVNAVLDAWRVPRERDESTGQLAHPALVFVVDAEGRIAFAANGDARVLEALLARL
ncbi:MAG TPA: SCO family protein [Myxococcota bacterium]|nr:SCO family protein [Myxococcota bacterium]